MNELEEGTQAAIDWEKLKRAAGSSTSLIPVVLQDATTLEVLFVGYANALALDETRRSGTATLWSASRDELWRKGATSGDVLHVEEIRVNCEQNSLLYLVHPAAGGACHTTGADGSTRRSCYYRRLNSDDSLDFLGEPAQ